MSALLASPNKNQGPNTLRDVGAATEALVFHHSVVVALRGLRQRLKENYRRVYPDFPEIIHLVLDQEEARAWQFSRFPHLLFPDLVEAHIERLNLEVQLSDDRCSELPTCDHAFA
jgi:hypothetical protein